MEKIAQKHHLNRIYARLFSARPQSLAIIGDWQMGKSTLLSQIGDPAVYKDFLPGKLNPLFRLYNLQDFGSNWKKLLQAICTDLASATGFKLQSEDYYRELQDMVKQYQEQFNFYILFDNFELLTQNLQVPLEFYSYLRSLANSYMIAYVTSSRASLQSLCVSQDICESPFFNIFTNLELKGFSEGETAELARLAVPQTDAELCYQVCSGHPGLTAKWLQMAVSGTPDTKLFVDEEKAYLQAMADQFDHDSKAVLQNLACGKAIAQPQKFIEETLRRKGYLNTSGRIASAALELYLQSAATQESKSLFKRLFKK